MVTDTLYAYGTLRTGPEAEGGFKPLLVRVPGVLYNLGSFPGIKLLGPSEAKIEGTGTPLEGNTVVCEKVPVFDWTRFDAYEGYDPADPASSLYVRQRLWDGWIYVFNRKVDGQYPVIPSGDWFKRFETRNEA